MKVVALISGGKDSCYNMMQCIASGHEIVALANLQPKEKDELDSFMYQTVGHMGVPFIAEAMGLPLFRCETEGMSKQRGRHYEPTDNDEVEDLYQLLSTIKEQIDFEAVAVGAILSDYQRVRVENVCGRLGLVSLCYLWRRDQHELLQEMIDCDVKAIIIKVAALGLDPARHLGRTIAEARTHLEAMAQQYGLNVCGEGGEYETFTLDCPLFRAEIQILESETVIHSDDPIAPVGYANLTRLRLVAKPPRALAAARETMARRVRSSRDHIADLNSSTYSDPSDPDLSETELEHVERRQSRRTNREEKRSTSRNANTSAMTNDDVDDKVSKMALVDDVDGTDVGESTAATTVIVEATGRDENDDFNDDDSCETKKNDDVDDGTVDFVERDDTSAADCSLLRTPTSDKRGGNDSRSLASAANHLPPRSPQSPAPPALIVERERRRILVEPRLVFDATRGGWGFLSGLYGRGPDAEAATDGLVETALDMMRACQLTPADLCSVHLYARDLREFATLNRAYARLLAQGGACPPVRACVELPLPEDCHVAMEAVFYRAPSDTSAGDHQSQEKHTMHVQGISHWAPANIGPYSQACRGGDVVHMAGQIGLIPGSMELVEGVRQQCKLSLRHVGRIALAAGCAEQVRDVVQVVCWLSHPQYAYEARRQFERCSNSALVLYTVGAPSLPRGADVEWSVWAHRHNKQFQYEETGCAIGDLTVAIRSRWNYEGTVCAAICHLSTGSANSTTHLSELSAHDDSIDRSDRLAANETTREQIKETLKYAVSKLLRHRDEDDSNESDDRRRHRHNTTTSSEEDNDGSDLSDSTATPPCATADSVLSLRIFYKVNYVDVDLIAGAAEDLERELPEHKILYTILPVACLQNYCTFVSICGLRFE